MKKMHLKLSLVFVIIFLTGFEGKAQDFRGLDKSPHDIAYYRTNKISPPLIKVLYGRPQKKGRKIFGSLIPYDQIWRVGADEATEIKFYEDVLFGDEKVKAGTYVLYAIPNEKEWTLILSSNLDVWGTYEYESKFDVVRVKAKVGFAESVESFSIGFKQKPKHVNMILGWDHTRVTLPITFY